MEFQAILLAGGRGSRMYPLTENIPKALLPVANRPLIWYPVSYLENAGFPEAIVIVSKSSAQAIGAVLEEFRVSYGVKMTFSLIETTGDDWGTADALRAAKSKIKSDLLVISCDLVTNVPLHLLADVYRKHNATAALLLAPERELALGPDAKKTKAGPTEKDIIGLSGHSQHLLFFCSEADLVDNLTMSRTMMKKHPHVRFHTDLLDGHLYMLKRWVLEYLVQNKTITSVKEELMPQLVKSQFQAAHMTPKPHPFTQFMDNSQQVTPAVLPRRPSHPLVTAMELAGSCHDHLEQLALQMSTGTHDSTEQHLISCHAHIASPEYLCIRVNTLSSYKQVNMLMPQYMSSLCPSNAQVIQPRGRGAISADSLVSVGVALKERVSVKHSIMDSHSLVGERTRLLLCVVMDHVTIGDNCNIQNSVICPEAQIEDNVILRDCIVGYRCTIPRNTDAKGETFVRESEEMNL